MKVIYMHHAERDSKKENIGYPELRMLEDITERGIKEAEIVADKLQGWTDVKAIYTSPYLRCVHTSEIVNSNIDVPIIEDERLNEIQKGENWKVFLERNIDILSELDKQYGKDDTIICMTSGVNLTAFICYFYNIQPTDNTIESQAFGISPINFVSNSSLLD